MSAYLYRLYAVQQFQGQKVGVYVFEGNFPDAKILSDAQEIVDGTRTRKEVMEYDEWMYGLDEVFPNHGPSKRRELTYYTRILRRSQKVVDENENVDKAIFVDSTLKKDWRGETTLYENRVFDTIKCDTPEYTACEEIGSILV